MEGDLSGEFSLTIDVGNAAMSDTDALADALEDVSKRVMRGDTEGRIKDLNGNTVGSFRLVED